MHVPFVDLRAQHDELRAEIDACLGRMIDSSTFIGGEPVESFEANFAAYCGTRHAVACANGTDALKLALMACGVRAGDEVITVPHTFIATTEAITMIGAVPVFVDIDGPTYHMAPARLAEFLETRGRREADGALVNQMNGRRIAAVLPVHLYGLPVDMAPILEIARSYGLAVVEDACQAHGATYAGRAAGALGDAAAFSFYPGKNLGAIGEAGGVTTDDARMDRMMRVWRSHGQVERYVHITSNGWNGRLDSIQCAVLDVKLARLDAWNAGRRRAAEWYRELLGGDERIVLPIEPEGRTHVYHLFVVRLPDRERAQQELAERGIGVGLHYPIPLHLQEAYHGMGWRAGDFPESERAAASILSLPMFPHITQAQVEQVCDALIESLDRMERVRVVGAAAAR
jgi:dTDP-4-amino-4,6-dideoxygalactose transaminase